MNPQDSRFLRWLANRKTPSCLISHGDEFTAQRAPVFHRAIVEDLLNL